jgi:hypothetical protein
VTRHHQSDQAKLDAGRDKELRTNILIASAVTVALATGALALWFVAWPPREPARAFPRTILLRQAVSF